MSKILKTLSFVLIALTTACTWQEAKDLIYLKPKRTVYGNDQPYIILQQPISRVIATCYRTEEASAESCAKAFEDKGYIRINNIPYKTADFDFLKTDTYPTRRWRNSEGTPRW